MAQRVDDLEVGVSLNDRDLVEGIAKAETRVDKFAAKVKKTKPVATVDLNLQKFKIGVREVNAAIKDLKRKDATVAIRADTRGFLRAYGEVRLAMARIGAMKATARVTANTGPFMKKMLEAVGMKAIFDKALARTPANFVRELSKMRVQMGAFSSTMGQAMTTLTLFGPVVVGVVGALGALTSVLGSATLGLGALGAAAAGGAIAGLSGVAMLLPSLLRDFKNLNTLQNAYHVQVLKTGANSDKAKTKLEEFNHALGAVTPTTRQAFMSFDKLQDRFRQLRKDARGDFFNALGSSIDLANKRFVLFRHVTLAAFHEVSEGWQRWMRGLQGNEAANIFASLAGNMRKSIGPLMDGLGNIATVLARIGKAAAHWLPTFSQQFKNWSDRLKESVQPGDRLNNTIDRMVGHLRDIGNLARAAGALLVTVFSGGVSSGDDMVNSLTALLTKWNTFLQSTKGQNSLKKFFDDAKSTMATLGPTLLNVVGSLAAFSEAVQPISMAMLQVVGALGSLFGLISTFSPALAGFLATMLLMQRLGVLVPIFKGIAFGIRAIGLASSATGIGLVVAALVALGVGLKYAYDHSKTFHRLVDSAFRAVKETAQSVLGWLATALPNAWDAIVAATRAVWPVVSTVVRTAFNSIKAVVQAGVTAVRGIIDIFGGVIHGDFSRIWKGIREVFSAAWSLLKGFMQARVAIFSKVADAIGAGMHAAFGKRFDAIVTLATGFINKVIDVINWPLKKLGIDTIGHIGEAAKPGKGAGGASSTGSGNTGAKAQLAQGGAFERTGGFVGAPITLMGEEAPQHPEWVIPTNPAYRDRAVGLWAAAGQSIGAFAKGGLHAVQGFAKGGRYSFDELKALWSRVNPGLGNPKVMAAIAMAESGGIPSRNNADRPGDGGRHIAAGLWQILGLPFPGNVYDPETNARMAGAKLRSQGLGAWEVYTKGTYKQYLSGKGFIGKIGNVVGGIADAVIPDINLPGVPKGLGPFGEVLGAVGKKIKNAAVDKLKDAAGSILPGGGGGGAGPGFNPKGALGAAMSLARSMGLQITSTTGGGHVAGSYHYQGRAFDASNGVNTPQEHAFFKAMLAKYPHVTELFFDPEGGIKRGRSIGAIGGHSDHVHVAFRKGGKYAAFKKGGKNQRKGATATKKKPLTKGQVTAKKKAYQTKIDSIDDQLTALRHKKRNIPGGKKGAVARKRIDAQIDALMRQRTKIQRLKRDLPTGVAPGEAAVRGLTTTLGATTARAQAGVTAAESTAGLGDDVAAATALVSATGSEVFRDANRLAQVNAALKRPLKPAKREELLQEREQLVTSVAAGRQTIAATGVKREELGIQRGFAGGHGAAGLDLMAAQAQSTEGLGDDVSVMNQQLSMWQQLLASRTKRGDLAGMTEAQQQINTLTSNIKDANDQMDQQVWDRQKEYWDLTAEAAGQTADLWDDVNAAQAQYNIAAAYANRQGAKYGWGSNEALSAMNAVRGAAANIQAATVKAQEAPLLANQALATLTDTTVDDIAAGKALLTFHEGRLAYYKSIGDYAGITEEAGTVKSLRDSLNQQQGDVFAQTRLFSEARADLYKSFGSNYDPITKAGTPMGGKSVVVNNYYKTMPMDPHNWSRDVLFELQAAG